MPLPGAEPGLHQLYTDAGAGALQAGWIGVENRSGPAVAPAALLEYPTRGVLTSLVRLPSPGPITLVRAPFFFDGRVNTAVALLNPETAANPIALRITDAAGSRGAFSRWGSLPEKPLPFTLPGLSRS